MKKIDNLKNQLKICDDLFEKAKSNFEIFLEKFNKIYTKEKNPKEFEDVELLQKYLYDFKIIIKVIIHQKVF